MGSTFTIKVPRDYLLHRDACSYGYFLLEPNWWDPMTLSLRRVLLLGNRGVRALIWQGTRDVGETASPSRMKKGAPLTVQTDLTLTPKQRTDAISQITRMLNLDEDHAEIRTFHRLDPRWKRAGRGRLFRSPSFFEDVIKTVTSCNVTWPSTVIMNRRLCEVVGRNGAFPSIEDLADTRPALLRARCSVGYRDERIVQLARLFADGHVNEAWVVDPKTTDAQVREFLIELPGIGPYAAANIMQLVRRYGQLPLDTESVRHGRTVLGFKGKSPAVMKRVKRHFEPFKDHAFRSYWFEMWDYYELKRGRAWTWDRETTGKTFTASALKDQSASA